MKSLRLALCVLLIAGVSSPALAAMGGGSSMGAASAAAKAGNAAAAGALSNIVSPESCSATCRGNGHNEASCRGTCRPGTCYYNTGRPFCIR
jgi:hypothetical protein